MKVAIYARVSKEEGDPRNQIRDLREYCKKREWEIESEYIDKGLSGAKADRPALKDLMRHAKKRDFDAVVVWKFDRFARSLQMLLEALQTFHALGIDFVSYTENLDTTTPAGKAMFGMIGVFAEFERSMIIERIHAGLRKARALGHKLGRPFLKVDRDELREYYRKHKSLTRTAKKFGISDTTVFRRLKEEPNPKMKSN